MRLSPLVMVGVYAFMLALNAAAIVLISRFAQPSWLWALNAVVMTSEIVAAGCCYRRAKTDERRPATS